MGLAAEGYVDPDVAVTVVRILDFWRKSMPSMDDPPGY
jgi:hypothetical protein